MIPHFVHAIRDIYSPPLCYTIIFALKFFLKILPISGIFKKSCRSHGRIINFVDDLIRI